MSLCHAATLLRFRVRNEALRGVVEAVTRRKDVLAPREVHAHRLVVLARLRASLRPVSLLPLYRLNLSLELGLLLLQGPLRLSLRLNHSLLRL